ncbi:uncharacterized protein LOC113330578 isoform X2 [Papaver somniferum]|uniref:uncharacterized protein LOC113330578 isoform X2 n=1 Tax=Papaver somniferum TaxID=3469 RepID=UPI000E6FB7B8|nr:uncharacterized protein LOC113330578 isoform X2 [Papaver somniferum]
MPIFSMEVADLDEFYPAELTEMELLSQKIYSLGRFQAAISEKLEGEFIRPPKQVTAWINFFSTEIKNILAMERRLCDENSEESLGLLQSVVQQLKTMKRYITDHMEPTSVYSDLVTHGPIVSKLVDFLRWKFKLYSTDLWNVCYSQIVYEGNLELFFVWTQHL